MLQIIVSLTFYWESLMMGKHVDTWFLRRLSSLLYCMNIYLLTLAFSSPSFPLQNGSYILQNYSVSWTGLWKAVGVLHVWQGRSHRIYKKNCLVLLVPWRVWAVQLCFMFLSSLCLIICKASINLISVIGMLKLHWGCKCSVVFLKWFGKLGTIV